MRLTSVQRRILSETGEGTRRERDRLSGRGNEDHRTMERQYYENPTDENKEIYVNTAKRRGLKPKLPKRMIEIFIPPSLSEHEANETKIFAIKNWKSHSPYRFRDNDAFIFQTYYGGQIIEVIQGEPGFIWLRHQHGLSKKWFMNIWNKLFKSVGPWGLPGHSGLWKSRSESIKIPVFNAYFDKNVLHPRSFYGNDSDRIHDSEQLRISKNSNINH